MTRKWLKTAPQRLIRECESRTNFPGRAILERLLADQGMRYAWPEIAKRMREQGIEDDDDRWILLWNDIAFAKHQGNKTNRRKRRSDIRDQYKSLARNLAKLAQKIGTDNNPMNVLAYQLLPDDVLRALHVPDLDKLNSLEQFRVAKRLLPCWPSAAELLHGMSCLAEKLADEAMTGPRPDERSTGNPEVRAFVQSLGRDLHERFDTSLYGTLAAIANVVFKLDEQLSREAVRNMLGGCVAKEEARIDR